MTTPNPKNNPNPGPPATPKRRRIGAAALLALVLLGILGCSSESSALGKYYKGRTLHISVVSLERVPELRYATCDAIDPEENPVDVIDPEENPACDPEGTTRNWSLSPSTPGMELVLANIKVANHTAVAAAINVDRAAAELRDFANATYRPLDIGRMAWQDFRGETEALVRVDLGQCFDGSRALIDPGTTVRWQSEAQFPQYIAFADTDVNIGPDGQAELPPQASLTYTFRRPGTYSYVCSDSQGEEWPAEIQIMPTENRPEAVNRSAYFLSGPFKILKNYEVDGYIVFEVPIGTQFRDLRWRAGDSITIRF